MKLEERTTTFIRATTTEEAEYDYVLLLNFFSFFFFNGNIFLHLLLNDMMHASNAVSCATAKCLWREALSSGSVR